MNGRESPCSFSLRKKEAKERLAVQGVHTFNTWMFLIQLHLLKYKLATVDDVDPVEFAIARQLMNDGILAFMPGPKSDMGTAFCPTAKGLAARQIASLQDRARSIGLS